MPSDCFLLGSNKEQVKSEQLNILPNQIPRGLGEFRGFEKFSKRRPSKEYSLVPDSLVLGRIDRFSKKFGYGRVNAKNAVAEALARTGSSKSGSGSK